jgi:hypothetical protein
MNGPVPVRTDLDISEIPTAAPVAVRVLWLPQTAEVDPVGRVGIHYALSQTPTGWHAQMLFWVREAIPGEGWRTDPPEDWRERARVWVLCHRHELQRTLEADLARIAPVLRWRLPMGAE